MVEKQPVALTKLIVPQRRKELLSRPRLLDLLSDLLDFRLIILAAPAGYGKTSLMIDFASHFEWPICWYALDPLDQDIYRFLTHLIYSIKQKFPEFGESSLQALFASPVDQINADYLISTITNDIYENIAEHFVVVLDDYHFLKTNSQIDQFLSDFIQRADENCHIVITSRKLLTLPDLPLMVARSQVGGLSVEELAFLPEEIQELFEYIFETPINNAQAEDLAAQTEGWITGLLLTSQMLKPGLGEQVKVARASGIGLYEYLTQQVLDQQPARLRDFLLNTSLLEEFNASMCAQVIGSAINQKENWQELINLTIQNNLFVLPVDDNYTWVRFHHLFRDFLQSTLQKERPHDAQKIKRQLAIYFGEKQEWERAFEIYSALGDKEAIVQLIENVGSTFISKGKINKLAEWLSTLPENIIYTNPNILSIKASIAVIQGSLQEGKDLLDKVIHIQQNHHETLALADNLIRRSAALRILGQYPSAMEDADAAIKILGTEPQKTAQYSEALRAKAANLLQTGCLNDALEFYNQALEISQKNDREEDTARILVEMGAVFERLGKYSLAENAYRKSIAYWHSIGDSIWQPTILNNLGVVQHLCGDFANSFLNFEKAMHYAQITGNRRMEGYSLASIADLYKDLDASQEAMDAYQQAFILAQQVEDQYLIFYLKMAKARMHLLSNDLQKAENQIRSVQSLVKNSGSPFEIHRCQLEHAALDFARKRFAEALERLTITSEYFKQAGIIEDSIRSDVLLSLSLVHCGQEKKAAKIIGNFLNHISDSDRHIPSLSVLGEIKDGLEILQENAQLHSFYSQLKTLLVEYQVLTQKYRRKIRKQATLIPFAPARLDIRAFGKAEVAIQNRVLAISDWKTQTSRDLFFLFLAHPEGLSKEEVGLIFWPDSSPAELKLRFKNAIYRMRHAIGSEVVIFRDDFYQFNRSIDYEYDVQNFLAEIERAKHEKNEAKKKKILLKTMDLYKGPYLPDIEDIWAETDRQKYLDLYMNTILDLIRICMRNKEFNEGLAYCQQALKTDTYNEEIYRLSMQIYALLGNKASLLKQFEICRKILEEDLNTDPSDQTIQLFNRLTK